MPRRIVCLPGDGIGPEVMAEAVRVLAALPLELELDEYPFGGAAIDAVRRPAAAETLAACRAADAVLLGAVGGPRWDGGAARPEAGLIGLRKELDVYANLRPALGEGVDLLIVRELVGGLYYGARGTREDGTVFDTCEYHPSQVERVARRRLRARRAAVAAGSSRSTRRTCSTPRACGAASSPSSPRSTPTSSCATASSTASRCSSSRDPQSFDVLVMENTFGDILSDVAAAVTGGLGLAASASLGDAAPGIFEPVHGSAPGHRRHGRCEPDRDAALARAAARARARRARARPRARGGGRARARRLPDARPRRLGDDLRFGAAVVAALASEVAA